MRLYEKRIDIYSDRQNKYSIYLFFWLIVLSPFFIFEIDGLKNI